MKPRFFSLLAMTLICATARSASPPSNNVAWQTAADDAAIARAFAQARTQKKPVLLYWGASWCPPCNQLKATLFNRQDFAALSRSFVAVNVDGDKPGAQKLGQRFKVSGYPTTVLFSADGTEITRLPGEVDAPQALAVLQLGLSGGRPVKAVLADALAGKTLAVGEWKLLAFYSWETDEQQLLPRGDVPATLVRLAASSPATDNETQTRLWLKALASSDDGKGVKPDAALRDRVMRVLADPAQARVHMDVLCNGAPEMVRALEGDAEAAASPLTTAFDGALKRLQNDNSLSRADRLGALQARVDLARLNQPKDAVQVNLPDPLLQELRAHVARADQEISDGYERQAVITAAGSALGSAGLWAESEALLKANLGKSHSPYYLMSQLASNARKQGRNDEALRWYGEAFAKSQGPATRLQWGSNYVMALVDLSPKNSARIEKAAAQLLSEAARDKGSFEGRSARSLQRASGKLVAWSVKVPAANAAATMRRLQMQRDALCAKVDAVDGQRAVCAALLTPASRPAS
jgi:thioredoxin-related protein/regulator of protease activity HflC (stomatin/prohibitin superfamily)